MFTTTRSRSITIRRRVLAGALAASFVPALVGGSPPTSAATPTDLIVSEPLGVGGDPVINEFSASTTG
ncbi:MAG TPA: hypothetical protein VES40_21605, partial [Ilumatobacteraceae bacterium]|nr:hypothetical protein [Ilumatobacteraceae bacterium]